VIQGRPRARYDVRRFERLSEQNLRRRLDQVGRLLRDVDVALKALRSHALGKEACMIGEVVPDYPGFVMMKTRVGGTRIVDMLSGEQLPRIC
jgi:hypothetical protein